MRISTAKITTYVISIAAVLALIGAMGGTWSTSQPAVAAPVLIPTATDGPAPPSSSSSTASAPRPPSPTAGSGSGSAAAPNAPPAPSTGSPPAPAPRKDAATKRALAGKINLNTATAQQLLLLPTVGPAKAERILVWRQKNGGFKRIADLRRVKGFGYKTWKRLEPYLDVTGDTTLAVK